MSNVVFKHYGAKGFATTAAKKLLAAAELIFNPALIVQNEEGKWGFWFNTEDQVPVGELAAEPEAEQVEDTSTEVAPEDSHQNAFGAMGTAMNPWGALTSSPAPSLPQARNSTSGYKIEKNREEQNGIKRPSQGTTCRAIWDELDTMSADLPANQVVKIKEWKARAAELGFDATTTTIQYYRWRNFQGVVGRQD